MDGEKLLSQNEMELAFYIGPEGGWSDEEKFFKQRYALVEVTLL